MYMNILICDDEKQYLESLKIHVQEYMKNHYIKANYYITMTPNELIDKNISVDLAFLDIQMPDVDGIELAKKLKKQNSNVILFFVTNFEQYQDEAMDLHIFRFFMKPFDVKRLYSSLDKAMEYLDESYIDVFLQSNGSLEKVLVDDIVYIRRENRKTILRTKQSKEYILKEKLEDWNDKLPNTFFYLVHKSFIVNLHYIIKYSYTELYLIGNIRVPIASRKQADFHKYWFQYLRRR